MSSSHGRCENSVRELLTPVDSKYSIYRSDDLFLTFMNQIDVETRGTKHQEDVDGVKPLVSKLMRAAFKQIPN